MKCRAYEKKQLPIFKKNHNFIKERNKKQEKKTKRERKK